MADFKIEAYKKSVAAAVERWTTKVEPVVSDMAKLTKGLQKKGVSIGGVVVAPVISINFKSFKVEKAGAAITFPIKW